MSRSRRRARRRCQLCQLCQRSTQSTAARGAARRPRNAAPGRTSPPEAALPRPPRLPLPLHPAFQPTLRQNAPCPSATANAALRGSRHAATNSVCQSRNPLHPKPKQSLSSRRHVPHSNPIFDGGGVSPIKLSKSIMRVTGTARSEASRAAVLVSSKRWISQERLRVSPHTTQMKSMTTWSAEAAVARLVFCHL
jgi:hypothetical protein